MNRAPSRAVALVLAMLVTVSLLAGVNRLAITQATNEARPLSAAPAAASVRGSAEFRAGGDRAGPAAPLKACG